MTTPFTNFAFTPPDLGDPSSIIRAILQLQIALNGGTSNPIPKNNLNVVQNRVPFNGPLFNTTSSSSSSSTSSGIVGATLIVSGGFL